jgi:hypothetical protein
MSARSRWPGVILGSGLALDLLVAEGATGPVRLVLALWFALGCTGMSIAPLLPVPGPLAQLAAGLAAGLALDTLLATAIVEIGGLSVTTGLLALQAVTLFACSLQLRAQDAA